MNYYKHKIILSCFLALISYQIVNAQSLIQIIVEEPVQEIGAPLNPTTGEPFQRTFFEEIDVIEFSPDGNFLLIVSGEYARIREVNTGSLITTFDAHGKTEYDEIGYLAEGNIVSAAFSEDGNRVITGGYRNTAFIWDPNTGEILHELKLPLEGGLHTLVFRGVSIVDDIALTSSPVGGWLWDLDTLQNEEIKEMANAFSFIVFDNKQKILKEMFGEFSVFTFPEMSILFNGNGGELQLIDQEQKIRVAYSEIIGDSPKIIDYDANTGKVVSKIETSFDVNQTREFSPTGDFITTIPSNAPNTILFYKKQNSHFSNTNDISLNKDNKIGQFKFSPDGENFAVVEGNKIAIYDVSDLTSSIPGAINSDN